MQTINSFSTFYDTRELMGHKMVYGGGTTKTQEDE
jgi:hypothetical protein